MPPVWESLVIFFSKHQYVAFVTTTELKHAHNLVAYMKLPSDLICQNPGEDFE